jgi:hypothetical protein
MIVRFVELPLGARFEFRGRRYEKVAQSMARDEERLGNVFHRDCEVVTEDPATTSPTTDHSHARPSPEDPGPLGGA